MEKRKVIGLCISFLIIGIIIGSISIVIAESINSNEVLYDNSNSSSQFDNVQDGLDDLYNIVGTFGSGRSMIVHNPEGLSSNLVAGLYRYQGIKDAEHDVDNYICFGTSIKNTCTGNPNTFLYRIIGINSMGQLKLIKYSSLGNIYRGGYDWSSTQLYNNLNSTLFLDNTDYIPDSSWKDKIATVNWHHGSITESEINVDASTIATKELNFNTSLAKIGLLYAHDYYYGLPGGNNCSELVDYSICKTSWLYSGYTEWTMNHWGSNYGWVIYNSGAFGYQFPTKSYGVRPVFYLKASETIASGNGTLADPYILS